MKEKIEEAFEETKVKIWQKWSIAFKIVPLLALILILKFVANRYGFEIIALNALFTSLVAGTIFLIGFLISGVLSDYKESEKIPGELAASLESLYDEAYTMYRSKNSKAAKEFLEYHRQFVDSYQAWFYKKEKTQNLLKKLSGMNDYFVDMEKEGIQAGFIIKMKNEQNNVRKLIIRTHTIRDTDFIASAYAIAESLAFAIIVGLIVIKMNTLLESMIFTGLVSFLVLYMIFLIRDLDNPFDYNIKGETGTEVSLKPFHDFHRRLKESKVDK